MGGKCLVWEGKQNFRGFRDFHGFRGINLAEKLHELHNDLPLLPKRMEVEKVEKLVAILHSKNKYIIHMRNLKQPLSHGLVLENVHKVIKFNQSPWLKPYIDMNIDLRKKTKNDIEKKNC